MGRNAMLHAPRCGAITIEKTVCELFTHPIRGKNPTQAGQYAEGKKAAGKMQRGHAGESFTA